MKLLRRGLTLITASLAIVVAVIISTVISWNILVASATWYNAYYGVGGDIIAQMPKVESVSLNDELNEVILNVRVGVGTTVPPINIFIYRVSGDVLNNVMVSSIDSTVLDGLMIIKVRLYDKLGEGNYVVRIYLNNKNREEVRFSI